MHKTAHGTAEFTLMVNNIFDALNAKLPRFGITSSSEEIEVKIMLYTICTTIVNEFTRWSIWKAIQEFLDAINETEENHIAKRTDVRIAGDYGVLLGYACIGT